MKQGKETDIYVRFEHEVEGQLMNSHCHVAIAVLPCFPSPFHNPDIPAYNISLRYLNNLCCQNNDA